MTKLQNCKYWREWAAVKRRLGDEATEELRHALHARALGEDKSSRDFTNADFDKVLAQFYAITRPASMDAQLRQLSQPHRRLLWRARDNCKLLKAFMDDPDPYVETILKERFRGRRIEHLDPEATRPYGEPELKQFAMTIWDRIQTMRRERGLTMDEVRRLAEARQ